MAKNEAVVVTDLFGDAVTLPSGRRGRPSYRWSQEGQDKVMLGLAAGYSDAEIAAGLGISAPTLRKYYFSTLKLRQMQRTRLELWRLHRLAQKADAGDVGAMKELGKLLERRDRHLAEERLKALEESGAAKALGKKEERAARAVEVESRDDLLRPGYGLN